MSSDYGLNSRKNALSVVMSLATPQGAGGILQAARKRKKAFHEPTFRLRSRVVLVLDPMAWLRGQGRTGSRTGLLVNFAH
jgi:hypothetical protein